MYIRRQSCHPARAGCTLHIATVLRRLINKMSEAASLARWALPREREEDEYTIHLLPHIFAFDYTPRNGTRRRLLLD